MPHELTVCPFQVNTLVCLETADDLPAIHDQVLAMGAARWSLFFLVSVGRGQVLAPVSAERAEAILSWAASLNGRPGPGQLVVTTTEAPHIRRIIAQRRRHQHAAEGEGVRPAHAHRGAGIRDGNGVMFISLTHRGNLPFGISRAFRRQRSGRGMSWMRIVRTRSSPCCAIPSSSKAVVDAANSTGCAVARVRARMSAREVRLPRIRSARTILGR